MSDFSQYLFAADLPMADRAARKQGWHPHGRTGWIKPDGNQVYFVSAEQLAALNKHATIYVVGERLPEMKRFHRQMDQAPRVMPRRVPPPWTAERIPADMS